jgi:hypothetical protein
LCFGPRQKTPETAHFQATTQATFHVEHSKNTAARKNPFRAPIFTLPFRISPSRHCERSEAIHYCRDRSADCFAPLAMTGNRDCSTKERAQTARVRENTKTFAIALRIKPYEQSIARPLARG